MVITTQEWKTISKYVPSDILSRIEGNIVSRSFKGKAVTIHMSTTKGDMEVPGLKLNDHWAICPVMKNGNISATKKCIVHIFSGLTCIRFSSKGKCLSFWNKMKDLDIHANDIMKSPDWKILRDLVVNEQTKLNGWEV